jgi:hypothetical protein
VVLLRKIFGSKKEELRAGLRKLSKEELLGLYSFPNNTGVIKVRRSAK